MLEKICGHNTLHEILKQTSNYLKQSDIEDPLVNAELILCHVLRCSKANLYANPDRYLSDEEINSIMAMAERRGLREPIQYIIGTQGFWSLDFKVTRDVLIPRPETEILIEETIKLFTAHCSLLTVLDLCTGSGCIAVTLAKELPDAVIYAVDISEHALEVAKENAEINGVSGRVIFLQGDIFGALSRTQNFDIIVSNPPYIKTSDIKNLEPEVKGFEPLYALDGGEDGLKFIRRIIDKAHLYLKENGWLMIEIGMGQADEVKDLLKSSGNYREISIIKDYSGIERVVKARIWTR